MRFEITAGARVRERKRVFDAVGPTRAILRIPRAEEEPSGTKETGGVSPGRRESPFSHY